MMAVKKKSYKKMTNAEKASRREAKKRLQEKGILPPDKKRLSRKKLAVEVMSVMDSSIFNYYDYLSYIIEGFACMLPIVKDGKLLPGKVTPEQVGALKVLKIAIELRGFWEGKRAEGINEAKVSEIYDTVIKPIIDL